MNGPHPLEVALGYPAWVGFVSWAFKRPDIRAEYEEATGRPFLTPPANALDILIDNATGSRSAQIDGFVLWVTETHYGTEYAPPAVQEAIAARSQAKESE